MSEVFKTKFASVVFKNENFAIFKTHDKTSVKGNLVGNTPEQLIDVDLELVGEWEQSKFGKTFKFDSYQIIEDQIVFFLTRVVSHVPVSSAKLISKTYGSQIWGILGNNPSVLLDVRGIGPKKLPMILSSWEKYRPLQSLLALLSPLGINNAVVMRIHDELGDRAIDVIKAEPYTLISVGGLGFKVADQIGIGLGVEPTDPQRLRACAAFSLRNVINREENSVARPSLVIEEMRMVLEESLAGVPQGFKFEECLKDYLSTHKSQFIDDSDMPVGDRIAQDHWITSAQILNDESFILQRCEELEYGQPIVDDIEAWMDNYIVINKIQPFGDQQRDAIRLANKMPNMFCISGYAGTGKTTIAKTILNLFARRFGHDDIYCTALAGVAADHIKTKSGFEGGTIHSLLGFDGEGFEFNAANKLEYKFIALDEAGMADAFMVARLMEAIDPQHTTLMLLGDDAQVKPVGKGQPFADILKYNLLPRQKLTKIYRTSADQMLTTICAMIRMGEVPNLSKSYEDFEFRALDLEDTQDIRKRHSKAEAQAIIRELREKNNRLIYQEVVAQGEKFKSILAQHLASQNITGFIHEFQVVSPMRKGILGVDELNKALQRVINPPVAGQSYLEVGDRIFRKNDKVLHRKNMDMKVVKPSEAHKVLEDDSFPTSSRKVFNGQLGVVVHADENGMQVFYPNQGYVALYGPNDATQRKLDHGFALTIHKTQGSEFKNTVMPLTLSHYNMLSAKILYTGWSRAKSYHLGIGERAAVQVACKNLGNNATTVISLLCDAKAPRPVNRPAMKVA